MEENVIENESEANEMPANEFACLGIAECQQVLERLKGGILIGELPSAAKALMEEYKYDEDTLRREVLERKAELERHRNKAVELQIAKNYAQALEGYEEYFAALGSQVVDYEAERQRKECQQYLALAKKRKWQTIVAVVMVLVVSGVIVDQVAFRKNIKVFQAALQDRDLENATRAAIKISWRYDTEEGIENLVCFLDERDEFNELCGQELTRSSLDGYGGANWQEVLKLVERADANEDLSQGIEQLRQASEMTMILIERCVALGVMKRDFNAMYESCNQKDADHYAHGKWVDLQQLRGMEVTQTNLALISERYALMVEITNQVARLMDAQMDMQPVKDDFGKRLNEEQIQVQGMLNYSSSQLDEAQRLGGIALIKEEGFEFTDARLIYTRAIEHIKASQKTRQEDSEKLIKIDQAKREFDDLYKRLDIELAQARCPDEWRALSGQKKKADAEYAKKERWKGDAYVEYKAAVGKLKNLMDTVKYEGKMYESKEGFDRLYGKLNPGLAEKLYPSEWNALKEQKKKADAAYESEVPDTDDVIECYSNASQMLKDLLVGMSDEVRRSFSEKYKSVSSHIKKILEESYPDDWNNLQNLIEKAKVEYMKPGYWKGDDYIEAEKMLSAMLAIGEEEGRFKNNLDLLNEMGLQ